MVESNAQATQSLISPNYSQLFLAERNPTFLTNQQNIAGYMKATLTQDSRARPTIRASRTYDWTPLGSHLGNR